MNRISFITIISTFLTLSTFAQQPDMGRVEQDLLKSFKKISYYSAYSDTHPDDTKFDASAALDKANDEFEHKLKNYTSTQPATITWQFSALAKEGMHLAVSRDGLFRIYSWDTLMGGTMHFFDDVVQYRQGNKIYTSTFKSNDETDPGSFYSDVFDLKVNDKTYYLVISHSIASTKDASESIRIFSIDNGQLTAANIFKTGSGMHNKLQYNYDFFSITDKVKSGDIHYDPAVKVITLPVVAANGRVTNNRITYQFNGQYFERIKS